MHLCFAAQVSPRGDTHIKSGESNMVGIREISPPAEWAEYFLVLFQRSKVSYSVCQCKENGLNLQYGLIEDPYFFNAGERIHPETWLTVALDLYQFFFQLSAKKIRRRKLLSFLVRPTKTAIGKEKQIEENAISKSDLFCGVASNIKQKRERIPERSSTLLKKVLMFLIGAWNICQVNKRTLWKLGVLFAYSNEQRNSAQPKNIINGKQEKQAQYT